MRTQTPTEQLADMLLDRPLSQFVQERRPQISWRLIARDLMFQTNGRVDVTHETLRGWFGADATERKAS